MVFGAVTVQPVCLATTPDPTLAFLHLPSAECARETAVLLCPPFGWEEMCSYRARRRWAQALAEEGYPTARIDLPGSGDSGGSAAVPRRLEASTKTVSDAAQWLRERTGCVRLAAIGIGIGGMLSCDALGVGAPIDDLILWGVPAHGRTLLRELRAYSGMVAARYPADLRPLPDGALELTGFLMTAETARALEALRLTELDLPVAPDRRVLLLERGGLGIDERLKQHFEQCGASVTVADGSDYDALIAHPQQARTPVHAIASTISWLPAGVSRGTSGVHAGGKRERDRLEFCVDGEAIWETPMAFELEEGQAFGVRSEPADAHGSPVCAMLLNGGALRHTGPNRTWVEIARRWAARGVPTVRLDLLGIGDSDGEERERVPNPSLYAPETTSQVLTVLEQLRASELPERFVLAGLCSGAYWALHGALADARVVGALMINLYAFYWSAELVAERETRDALTAPLRGTVWRKLARRDVETEQLRSALARVLPGRIRAGARRPVETAEGERINRALDQLRDQQTEALLLFSQGEPLYDQLLRQRQLERLDSWPNLIVDQIPSADHMFRALWLQRYVHDSVDRALERSLARSAASQIQGRG